MYGRLLQRYSQMNPTIAYTLRHRTVSDEGQSGQAAVLWNVSVRDIGRPCPCSIQLGKSAA